MGVGRFWPLHSFAAAGGGVAGGLLAAKELFNEKLRFSVRFLLPRPRLVRVVGGVGWVWAWA